MKHNPRTAPEKALILVVHAQAAHSRPVETILEGAGYEVVSASEADEIRALLEYGRPDLVVVAAGDPAILAPITLDGGNPPVLVVAEANQPRSLGAAKGYCSLATLVRKVRAQIAKRQSRIPSNDKLRQSVTRKSGEFTAIDGEEARAIEDIADFWGKNRNGDPVGQDELRGTGVAIGRESATWPRGTSAVVQRT